MQNTKDKSIVDELNNKRLQMFATEEFKEIELDGKLKLRYAISNFGRLISFTDKFEDGRVVKGSITEGYRIFRYKFSQGKKMVYKHKFFYKLVAESFLEKTSDDQAHVIHLDHNLSNDMVSNLKWTTRQEMLQHQKTSPKVQKARIETNKRLIENAKNKGGSKLNTTKVMLIKKLLANPTRKTRMKMIAKQFGVSEMQLYRIKKGENWGHVKIYSLISSIIFFASVSAPSLVLLSV